MKVNETTLYIPPGLLLGDDDDDDDAEVAVVPFGNYYLFFMAIGIITLVVIHWKRKPLMKVKS